MPYGLYDCWNCLCEVCTRYNCPKNHLLWISKHYHCCKMRSRDTCPVIKCDFFEHKQIHKRYIMIRKHGRKHIIIEKLDEILNKLDKLENKTGKN